MAQEHLFRLQAELCKTLAHPKRLMILHLLSEKGPLSVGEIAQALGLRRSNVSQHLALLRAQHVVRSRQNGQIVLYEITDPRIPEAGKIIREALLERLQREAEQAQKASQEASKPRRRCDHGRRSEEHQTRQGSGR